MVYNDYHLRASHLGAGGLLVYGTETFCALGCRSDNEEAITAIFAIKGRDKRKPLPLIAGSFAQAEAIADLNEAPASLLDTFWPGPLALVLPALIPLASGLLNHQNKVCLRISAARQAASLAKICQTPLVATSANLSGQAPAASAEQIEENFWAVLKNARQPWAIFAPPDKDTPRFYRPSTIIEPKKTASGWTLRILRHGCIPEATLKKMAPANIMWETA